MPASSVVVTTERTFVIRMTGGGRAEWVNVRRGGAAGDLVEVLGPLVAGDRVPKVPAEFAKLRPGGVDLRKSGSVAKLPGVDAERVGGGHSNKSGDHEPGVTVACDVLSRRSPPMQDHPAQGTGRNPAASIKAFA